MISPLSFVFILLSLIVSARTRPTLIVHGAAVSVPVLWLVAADVVLALAAVVLWCSARRPGTAGSGGSGRGR